MKRSISVTTTALAVLAAAIWMTGGGPATAQSGDPLVEGFKTVAIASVADAVDQVTGKAGFMNYDMRPVIPGRIAGRALTARIEVGSSEAGNAVSHSVQMIDEANPGEVGVIVIEDGLNVAGVGGLMMTAAKARAMGGMVIDGGARDLPEIRQLGVPVYARSVTPATSVGRRVSVAKNQPVTCAGVRVTPGDILVGDEDGVVVVPQAHAKKILEVSREIDDREGKMVPMILELKSLTETVKKFNRI
jgi:4-hydroxy-4-methyl-2-oxoglutarate aldolase